MTTIMWNRSRVPFAAASLILALASTSCVSTSNGVSADKCLDTAKRENAAMQAAVSPALRDDKMGEVSIYEMNGCDSADNGAWLDAEIEDTMSKEEIDFFYI